MIIRTPPGFLSINLPKKAHKSIEFALLSPDGNFIDTFGTEHVMAEFWLCPWKAQKNWRSISRQCVGLRYRNGKLIQAYFYGFWEV